MTMNSPTVPRGQGAGAGRVIAVVSAVLLLIIGACVLISGVALMALFGTTGEISSAKHPVASPTAAVVTDIAAIRNTSDVADALGTPVATFAANGGNAGGLFIGVGPAAAVDRYLAGVEHDQLVDFELDPYQLNLARQAGTGTTPAAPVDQDFWVASASGSGDIDVRWQVSDGDYRMVLMNADGAAGIQSQLSVGLGLRGMFLLSLGLLIGGLVVIGLAVMLLVLTSPRRRSHGFAGGYVPPGGSGPRPAPVPPMGNGPPAGYAPQGGYPPPPGYAPPAGSPTDLTPPRGFAAPPSTPPGGYAPPAAHPAGSTPPGGYAPSAAPPPGSTPIGAYPPPIGNPPPAGHAPPPGDEPGGPVPPEPLPPVREPQA
jgi:hypothetical protein